MPSLIKVYKKILTTGALLVSSWGSWVLSTSVDTVEETTGGKILMGNGDHLLPAAVIDEAIFKEGLVWVIVGILLQLIIIWLPEPKSSRSVPDEQQL